MSENMGNYRRTMYCGELREKHIDEEMVLCGFVQKQRVFKDLIFIVLRDRTGIVQLAFDSNTDKDVFEKASQVRSEYVLMAKGIIKRRESINPNIPTGIVEMCVTDLKILSRSETPPFEIRENLNVKEELRLKHRAYDLRNPKLQNNIITRHKIAKATRDYYDENGFIEIETPILIKSTPEGARDYLVPSRVHQGTFYSLPQSPQIYKQLLMSSGFDKYIQIAKCMRDEDLRADRQPEFTQIDVEMSYVDVDDVIGVAEGFVKHVFKKVLDKDISLPLKRMTYIEAMDRFGSDKPDLRFGLELVDLSDKLKSTDFNVFSGAISGGGSVRAINAKGLSSSLSRKGIDKLTKFVREYGAKGLAYSRIQSESIESSFDKFLSEEEKASLYSAVDAKPDDVIFVVADADNDVVFASLGALRCEIAKKCELYGGDNLEMLWVTDFPLFEYDKDNDRYVAKHHPFTSPKDEDMELLKSNPSKANAKAYDIVMNGYEVGGGSIRINDPDLQRDMFSAIGMTPELAEEQFGFLLEAFKYGVPPHGGIAFGLERLTMIMAGTDNIKDVIAFPKLQNASDPMSQCPAPVDPKQLEELGICIKSE